jgi:biotin carboxylase
MKKALLLGGSFFQVPSVQRARELGYYVITCDNVPTNPGHAFAHEYHNVSTTDKEGVLELARRLKVDGVVCYASDPAAPTAAYVCERMGFPTHPYDSVEILCNKDRFRKFLTDNDFFTPKAIGYAASEQGEVNLSQFSLPVIVKPVDSSGSKGVTKVVAPELLPEAIQYALSFSRCKRFVVEEFIEPVGYLMSGDGFSWNGKLVFRLFNNDHRRAAPHNPYITIALSTPFQHSTAVQDKMHSELQRAFDLLGLQHGTYNFDIRVCQNGEPMIMEIGPRSGGNCIPELSQLATGIDMIKLAIQAAMGEDCGHVRMVEPTGFWSSYVLHSNETGILKAIEIDPEFRQKHLVSMELMIQPGSPVKAFQNSSETVGILLLRFESENQMLEMLENLNRWVRVSV